MEIHIRLLFFLKIFGAGVVEEKVIYYLCWKISRNTPPEKVTEESPSSDTPLTNTRDGQP